MKNIPTSKQITVFVFGISIICLLLLKRISAYNNIPLILLLIIFPSALIFFFFTKRDIVVKFYKCWMRIITPIGIIITGILLIIIFYFVFAPIGLFLKLMKKDILCLKFNRKADSYWIDKPQAEFKKEDYEKQF